ncbi:MAG TPA: hypothetical protein VIO94_08880, partial [Phenylobacterium sp.]
MSSLPPDTSPKTPDEHAVAVALALLAQGRDAEGWAAYEARRKLLPDLNIPSRLGIAEWQGESLAGKHILVFPEQGFGDQLLASRFIVRLKAMAAGVVVLCPAPLVRLFGATGVEVFAWPGELNLPPVDVWTPIMSLPFRFGATLETIPPPPY